MATGYSGTPKLLKGALIQFSAPLLIPIPNIIVFQYNPDSLSRTLTPWVAPTEREWAEMEAEQRTRMLAQPFDPEESFTVALELDASDALEVSDPVAVISGVADRLAALEMLCYPSKESVLGGLLGAAGGVSVSVGTGGISASLSGGGQAEVVPRPEVPVVLLFWGPGRIVPVRITSFAVDEQAFSPLLYPILAKVSVGMKVLTPDAFRGQEETAVVKIAKAAYQFTRAQKEVLALANVANTAESIVGMLPI